MSTSLPKQEKKFFDALNDIFVWAKIEWKWGYINLMNIKNKYYKEHIYWEIIRFIEKRFSANNSNREELFARLYTFFNRYFNETWSIYFQYTPLKENIYERVYSNKEDVSLFYKTHMLYYVKSERIFNSVDLKVEDNDKYVDFHFNFDVSKLELTKNNEKKEIIFQFERIEKKKVFLNVVYSAKWKKTDISEILKFSKDLGLNEDLLKKALTTYKKQAEVDYFINKDAKKFLKEQFNLWYYSYLFWDSRNGEFEISDFDDRRIRELQWTKEIAYKIIDFISQFEDELVKVWNKPKFVRNSNYVLTLDKLENNTDLIKKILSHKNFEKQEQEWKDLWYKLDNYSKEKIIQKNSLNEEFKFLTIDTKYFEDIKYDILDIFDDLDDELNWVLINSDNYQALNTLQHKYKWKVKCIYIDPPYNTWSDGFIYKDWIKHWTWLTMMENRLNLAKDFLTDDGFIFISIDDNEQAQLKILCDNIFWEENFISNIVWKKKRWKDNSAKFFSKTHEYLFCYSKDNSKAIIKKVELDETTKKAYKNKDNDERWNYRSLWLWARWTQWGSRYDYKFKNWLEIKWLLWLVNKASMQKLENDSKLIFVWNKVYRKLFLYENKWAIPETLWLNQSNAANAADEIKNIFWKQIFDTVKAIDYIKYILKINVDKNDIILDFFSWSWTTQHSVIELNKEDWWNRKYIWVEMWEHFDGVIKPRIKKVVNSKEWKEWKALDNKWISHFMKYSSMEQYEEALEKVKYSENTIFTQMDEENKDIFSNYIFLKDEKFTESIELDLKNWKTKIDLTKIYDDIDIWETLSNITWRKIKKIKKDSVILDWMDEIKFDDIPLELVKPLIWWK